MNPSPYPKSLLAPNDKLWSRLIWIFSSIVLLLVVLLGRVEAPFTLPFDVHVFASINAVLNSLVSICLIWGYFSVRRKHYQTHKRLMLTAITLSVLFLLSYVTHHLFAGDTSFGGQGWIRYVYYFILISHIILAATTLPFILVTAYRGLSAQYGRHKKLARLIWPFWLYVSTTGVLVYLLISPYY